MLAQKIYLETSFSNAGTQMSAKPRTLSSMPTLITGNLLRTNPALSKLVYQRKQTSLATITGQITTICPIRLCTQSKASSNVPAIQILQTLSIVHLPRPVLKQEQLMERPNLSLFPPGSNWKTIIIAFLKQTTQTDLPLTPTPTLPIGSLATISLKLK